MKRWKWGIGLKIIFRAWFFISIKDFMRSMRTVLSYKARGKEFKVWALLWGDFLLLNEDPQAGYLKVISEFNKDVPQLNKRQMEGLFASLVNNKSLKKEQKKKEIDFGKFFLIEGALMHYLHQDREAIRSWTLEYVMEMMELLPAITGQNSYDEVKNKDKPDKKALKNLKKDLKK